MEINLGKVVPQKGVDYYTEQEKAELKNEIEQEIGIEEVNQSIQTLRTQSGHSVELSLNQTTYVLTLVLKNVAGQILNTQTIDLPNENAITNITYNNGILTTTKQSGTTSDIDITGLIDGLLTETDFNTFTTSLQIILDGINDKDTEQDEAIEENYKDIIKLKEENTDLKERVTDAENNQLTGQAEGTSIDLSDSADSRVKEMKAPQGNSTQETTTGKQLFNNESTRVWTSGYNTVTKIDTGIKLTLIGETNGNNLVSVWKLIDLSNYVEKTVRMKSHITKSGNHDCGYVLGLINSDGSTRVTKSSVGTDNQVISFTVPEFQEGATEIYLGVWFYLNRQSTFIQENGYTEFNNLIVTIDNDNMSYEPYTGGIPAPNPDYEEEIKTTGTNGVINEKIITKNLLEITEDNMLVRCSYVSGANTNEYKLLCTASDMYVNEVQNIGTAYNKARNGNLIPCAYGDTIYFDIGNSLFAKNYFNEYDENFISLGNYNKPMSSGSYTPTNQNCKYVTLRFGYGASAQAGTTYTLAPIISKMSDTYYVPFKEQTFSIPTQQPMRSIGTTRDCFFKNTKDSEFYDSNLEENKWYERHSVLQLLLNGSEPSSKFSIVRSKTNSTYFQFESPIFKSTGVSDLPKGLCNWLIPDTADHLWSRDTNGFTFSSSNPGNFRFNLPNNIASTIEELRTWLSTNNLEIIGEGAQPTNLQCTEEQTEALEAYMKARTYKNVTHFYSEDETPSYKEVVYYKDLETYLENIVNATISQGANV